MIYLHIFDYILHMYTYMNISILSAVFRASRTWEFSHWYWVGPSNMHKITFLSDWFKTLIFPTSAMWPEGIQTKAQIRTRISSAKKSRQTCKQELAGLDTLTQKKNNTKCVHVHKERCMSYTHKVCKYKEVLYYHHVFIIQQKHQTHIYTHDSWWFMMIHVRQDLGSPTQPVKNPRCQTELNIRFSGSLVGFFRDRNLHMILDCHGWPKWNVDLRLWNEMNVGNDHQVLKFYFIFLKHICRILKATSWKDLSGKWKQIFLVRVLTQEIIR